MKSLLWFGVLLLAASLCRAAVPPTPVTPSRTNAVLALTWDLPGNLSGITGYIIRHGTAPGVFTDQMLVPGATSTNTYWSNAVTGVTHYFAAYSVNAGGLESEPSNVVASTVDRRPDPPQLRQVVPLVVVIQSRPSVNDPWEDRLRLGPFNALASLPSEQFRVSLEAAPSTPVLPDP